MIRRYTLSPPLAPLPGDTFAVVAGVLEQRRGGALVAFRVLAETASAVLTGPEIVPAGPTLQFLYLEEPEMAAKTVQSVALNASGSIQVTYSDGSGSPFASREALEQDPRVTAVGGEDWLIGLLLARWLALNPALNDASQINGTTAEVNLASVLNPVSIGQA